MVEAILGAVVVGCPLLGWALWLLHSKRRIETDYWQLDDRYQWSRQQNNLLQQRYANLERTYRACIQRMSAREP